MYYNLRKKGNKINFMNREFLEKILWGSKDRPYSLRKQLSRLITFCCVTVVCIQAAGMDTMLISQYVQQERSDTLYILESDNTKMDTTIQYLEEMALSIQHNTGLRGFFRAGVYHEETAEEQLKTAGNLFSERNQLDSSEPFVEKIYLFNDSGKSIHHLYYPTTMKQITEDQEKYAHIYQEFLTGQEEFYYNVEEEHVNLCMWLYDADMKPLGACIFALNKSGIEHNYDNLSKMKNHQWSIYKDDQLIMGQDNFSLNRPFSMLEHTMKTGFGLSLYAGVSSGVIYQSLGTTVSTVVLISVALILLLSFLGHALAVYYVKPLETVAEKIKLVGKGNFDTKLSEYRVEELQNISDTFNEMTDYIDRLVKEVYETQLIAKQSQIQYLQAQMNPHFLFNILSMIEMRAAFNKDHEVQQMLYKLSKLYQGKIFRKNEHFIYLEEEMEIVDFYLSLQNGRFGEKITYAISYEGNKEEYNKCMVPRLSIEPIVENAVCHGLEPKDENGHIQILVSMKEDTLRISIEDNGVGFDPNLLKESKEDRTHSHVGLWNTNKMIHNLCGDEYGLEIESKIGEGTKVSVVLPIKCEGNYVESNDCRRRDVYARGNGEID